MPVVNAKILFEGKAYPKNASASSRPSETTGSVLEF
jgi:hypothetical protein